MTTQVTQLFNHIWQQYLEVTPSADKVHQLLGSGNDVINDHVAYRTFNIEKVNLEKLAAHLIKLGYKECGEYHFEAKKLYAKHFEHADSTQPKVFISELLVEEFSPEVQAIIHKLVDQLPTEAVTADNFLYSGKQWDVSFEDYKTLLAESEYAAWMAAWGYRANHFTVSINHLENHETIESVNEAVKAGGFALNSVGGEIKGDKAVKLEQSSTMADKAPVAFSDKTVEIPSCFYEFAKRYPLANGELYTGFVAASADKIFESTNAAA
ncbi:MAG: succinyldiaminopimelate aminotransferase [Colwelliaceae bacterium]|nr:succinyldiaminopimelate aminotransferase [Colwelliaceae bacterium]|tara:strand:+ start:266 stop:1066 length:801 start_codon:yes stop_codon:yes gene_type:complete